MTFTYKPAQEFFIKIFFFVNRISGEEIVAKKNENIKFISKQSCESLNAQDIIFFQNFDLLRLMAHALVEDADLDLVYVTLDSSLE